MTRIVALSMTVLLLGCNSDAPAPAAPAPQAVAPAPASPPPAMDGVAPAPGGMSSAPVAVPASTPAQATPPPKPRPKAGNHIDWGDAVAWKTWEEGLALAKAGNRSIGLLVYANWCPHCRELAPVFRDPAVVELTKPLVMIRQDQEERPAYLNERFGAIGSYVPRLLFLSPDGTLREDIRSTHPRYPYFYTPQKKEALEASLRKAQGI